MASGLDSAPHYHSTAHVFRINPETKNSWLPKGEQAIPIKFVVSIVESPIGHQSRRELKIIGTDNGEIVLDVVISPKTTFTKRSHKFGQWIDDTGTVYGLGFNAEAELAEFIETFQRLQKEILSPLTEPYTQAQALSSDQPPASHSTSASHDRLTGGWQSQDQTNNNSETNGRYPSSKGNVNNVQPRQQQYSNTLAHPGHQQAQMKRQQQQNNLPSSANSSINDNGQSTNSGTTAYSRSQSMFGIQGKTGTSNNNNITSNSSISGKVTPENDNSFISQSQWRQYEQQLKYENERLRQALEESSKNAGIWHNELLTLRTNNVKLTQALQESKAHVGEWERELSTLRVENQELKVRVSALESNEDPEKEEEYKEDLLKYKSYVEEVQGELRRKENEIEKLQRSMEELELRHQAEATENGHLDDSVISTHQKQKFDVINAKFEVKINELLNVQKEFAQMVEKLYH